MNSRNSCLSIIGICVLAVFLLIIGSIRDKASYNPESTNDSTSTLENLLTETKSDSLETIDTEKNSPEDTSTENTSPEVTSTEVTSPENTSSDTESHETSKNTSSDTKSYESYDEGYEAIYEDDDYDYERYQNDPDYADGVDDAMDELDW